MNIGPIVRVLEDVPATIPVEREPADAPAPRDPNPVELPQPGRATTLVFTIAAPPRRRS
ncbi:MAG: hypothetical protein ACREN5_04010 [Gemmatimonadales bacterium]